MLEEQKTVLARRLTLDLALRDFCLEQAPYVRHEEPSYGVVLVPAHPDLTVHDTFVSHQYHQYHPPPSPSTSPPHLPLHTIIKPKQLQFNFTAPLDADILQHAKKSARTAVPFNASKERVNNGH